MPNYQGGKTGPGTNLDWTPTNGGGWTTTDPSGDVLTLTPAGNKWAWTAVRSGTLLASGSSPNVDRAASDAIDAAF